MSKLIISSTPLYANSLVICEWSGFGFYGVDLPPNSVLANDVNSGMDYQEIRAVLLSQPVGLTVRMDDYGRLSLDTTPPNGTYVGTYEFFVDNVSQGVANYTITVGTSTNAAAVGAVPGVTFTKPTGSAVGTTVGSVNASASGSLPLSGIVPPNGSAIGTIVGVLNGSATGGLTSFTFTVIDGFANASSGQAAQADSTGSGLIDRVLQRVGQINNTSLRPIVLDELQAVQANLEGDAILPPELFTYSEVTMLEAEWMANVPQHMIRLDPEFSFVQIYDDGRWCTLPLATYREVLEQPPAAAQTPVCCAIYPKLYVWPIADQNYSIRIHAYYHEPKIEDTTMTNAWIREYSELLSLAAAVRVATMHLQDFQLGDRIQPFFIAANDRFKRKMLLAQHNAVDDLRMGG